MAKPICRLLPFAVADGPANMAVDEVLLETAAASGVASLRFYGWTEATLSLGYFQPAAVRSSNSLLAELPFVRRPSGGAALVHHHEVTYALALPPGSLWQKRGESWIQRMHGVIGGALGTLGVTVRACCTGEEKKLGDVLCFLDQTPCDLLLGAHKVVGSAQRKRRGALLQHGAILLAQSPHAPALPGLHELAGLAGDDSTGAFLRESVVTAFAAETNWTLELDDWNSTERQRIEDLIAEKYTSAEWNSKR
jgi:lipoate-protein ligase A